MYGTTISYEQHYLVINMQAPRSLKLSVFTFFFTIYGVEFIFADFDNINENSRQTSVQTLPYLTSK